MKDQRKTLKLSKANWQRLYDYSRKGESFDEALGRLLDLTDKLGVLLPMMQNIIVPPKPPKEES